MKTTAKRTGAMLAAAAYGVTLFAGLGFAFGTGSSASAASNEGLTYYYSGLRHNPRAERYYKAFEELDRNGSLKKNEVDYNLVENGTTVGEDVRLYVEEGSSTLPVAFGAGRDAFLMDHPDIFYADLYGVSVSAGVQNGQYVAYLDTSRVDSIYLGALNSVSSIDKAIDEYEAKIAEVVDGAKAKNGVIEKIKYVNQYIIDNVEYSFGVEEKIIDGDKYNVDNENITPYINTAYGALVNGEAVCGGYAKAFKAVLDRLDIPCVCVQGYKRDDTKESSPYDAHMWNAVQVEGQWYAVDPTWNDTANKPEGWMLLGELEFSKDHIEDNVISSSGYELKYPALKPYNYGKDVDSNGMEIKGEYSDSPNGTGKICEIKVTYFGKGARKLQEEGKYLTVRIGDSSKDGSIVWQEWVNFVHAADFMFPGAMTYTDKESKVALYANTQFVQFAVVDYAPDNSRGATYPESPSYYPDYYTPEQISQLVGKPCYYTYFEENFTENHYIVQPSTPYQNDGYGSYIPAPAATGVTPTNTGSWNVNGTYNMKFVYSDKLVLMEGKTANDVKLGISTSRGNDTVNDNVEVTDFKWDGDRTITFTFKPSRMFIHNQAVYSFYPTNLMGQKSSKVPEPVQYTFKGKSVVCSKIFNDGRLYMSVYGAPQMLDTSDLSTSGFKDENGNFYAESQRSQLILVADRPAKAREDELKDVLADEGGLKEEDVITTATYEISLQICGVVRTVPNGSYMQVAFGFPEGFSPDDAGTTFKIYHYKHDNPANPTQITGVEEIPVIVTEYGLIARVNSFSPFAVVQVKKSAVTESAIKSVYASVLGEGGTLTNENGNSGIIELSGDSVTLNVTAKDGYAVDRLLLNGKAMDKSRYEGGSVTLTKEELLSGNTLEASFVTQKSVDNYQAKGVEIKQPDMIIVNSSTINDSFKGPEGGSQTNVAAIVISSVVLAAVLVTGAVAITYVAKH